MKNVYDDYSSSTYWKLDGVCQELARVIKALDKVLAEGTPDSTTRHVANIAISQVSRQMPLSTISQAKQHMADDEGSVALNTNQADGLLRQTLEALVAKRNMVAMQVVQKAQADIALLKTKLGKPLFDKLELLKAYLQTGKDSQGNVIAIKGMRQVLAKDLAGIMGSEISISSQDPAVIAHYAHSELLLCIKDTARFYGEITSNAYAMHIQTQAIAARDAMNGVQDDFYVTPYVRWSCDDRERYRYVMVGGETTLYGTYPISINRVDSPDISRRIENIPLSTVDPITIITELQKLCMVFESAVPALVDDKGASMEAMQKLITLPVDIEVVANGRDKDSEESSTFFDRAVLENTILYGNVTRFVSVAQHLRALSLGIPIIMNYCLMQSKA